MIYQLIEKVELKGQYRFEKLSTQNFQLDPLSPTLGPNVLGTSDVFLGNRVDDYDAHIFTASVVYNF